MLRVAAIDCGTNSIRLLVAEPRPDGSLVEIDRRTTIVRLGQGIDATGEFHPDALDRTFTAIDEYAVAVREHEVDRVRFVATSAARDAKNRDVFADGVVARLGVPPEVVTGPEEARLSFAGVTAGIHDSEVPVLAMDIGGGSTELILGGGSPRDEVAAAVSLDIGAVRLTERFWRSDPVDGAADPPSPRVVAAAQAYVDDQLDRCGIDLASARTWIGVAGTVTSMAAIAQQLPVYSRAAVHAYRLSRTDLHRIGTELRSRPVAELRTIPSLHPQRADVIGLGALIAERVAARLVVDELVVSESDILDGIALSLVD